MKDYSPGDVVLLLFPFVDATGAKRRPALVLLDLGDDDIVVARITSQAARSTYDITLEDWREAGLLLQSITRLHKITTLEKRLVERNLGSLSAEDWEQVRAKLQELWAKIEETEGST
jgi:mRNA interferase MazF